MRRNTLRETGIEMLGQMPWSAHVSLFYAARSDLVDTIVSYLGAGLKNNELCAWRWTVPAIRRAVESGLRTAFPEYERLVARGSLVFIDARPWHRAKRFDPDWLIEAWAELVDRAGREKYDGLRACGEHTWRGMRTLREISQFEEALHSFVVNRRVVFLCAYPLADVDGNYLLDSARLHHVVIARRRGQWDLLESPALKATKEQIQQRNAELERAIAERTRQLARSEARALEARYEAAFEERTRLAREIHDSLLQGVTGIALQLRAALPRLSGAPAAATESIRDVRRARGVDESGRPAGGVGHARVLPRREVTAAGTRGSRASHGGAIGPRLRDRGNAPPASGESRGHDLPRRAGVDFQCRQACRGEPDFRDACLQAARGQSHNHG